MKAILMSIRPQHVANILNEIKTLEIRKRFPKDYVGWVYIYVTKGKPYLSSNGLGYYIPKKYEKYMGNWNGKVVARFWCDKVEEINSCDVPFTFDQTIRDFFTDTFNDMDDLLKASCLDYYSLEQYLKYRKTGYAIHITKLEIFDKPKEIKEFYGAFTQKRYERIFGNNAIELDKKYGGLRQPTRSGYEYTYPLTRAPQSYCFIEV